MSSVLALSTADAVGLQLGVEICTVEWPRADRQDSRRLAWLAPIKMNFDFSSGLAGAGPGASLLISGIGSRYTGNGSRYTGNRVQVYWERVQVYWELLFLLY